MKKCPGCKDGKEKDESEFSKNASREDGLQRYCKRCQSGKTKKHYGENRSYYVDKAKKTAAELKQFVDELKKGPCKDCGNRFNPWQMDFDHRDRSTKGGNISRLLKYGKKKLLAELEKCDLVCANCHRNRTHAKEDHAPVA